MMRPKLKLTDPAFRYVSAASTDIRKTFARVRREMAAREKQTVVPIKQRVQERNDGTRS